jgi:hypothetical protein
VITSNPFAELSEFIPPIIMQGFVVLMIVFVAGGTLYDTIHKRSAEYFFDNWRKAAARCVRKVSAAETMSLAFRAALEALASGEFCNPRRRIAHLLTMYGFLVYVITTAIMVFAYPTPATPAPSIMPQLWSLGALMICAGGYWFWFFVRVDVAAEGHSPWRIVHADLFILSLLASATLALIWAHVQAAGSAWANVVLGAYVLATTVLFGSVPWSKFSHMFFTPAAAFEKRVSEANGSRRNLPHPAAKPEIFGSAKRQPRHY